MLIIATPYVALVRSLYALYTVAYSDLIVVLSICKMRCSREMVLSILIGTFHSAIRAVLLYGVKQTKMIGVPHL